MTFVLLQNDIILQWFYVIDILFLWSHKSIISLVKFVSKLECRLKSESNVSFYSSVVGVKKST